MPVRRIVALSLSALSLAACGPSVKPAMRSATDQLAAERRSPPRDVAAAKLVPMKWAVGQWTLTRQTNEKGEPSYVRTAVVGREGGGWWIEMETQDYYQHAFTKVLYASQPTNVDEALDAVRKIVTRKDGDKEQVMDFTKDDPMIALMKRLASQYMKVGVAAVPADAAREDASVPAGSFRSCARFVAKAEIGPISVEATTWFHPAVPLSGAVKSASTDGKWTTVLVDYGLTGGTSRM